MSQAAACFDNRRRGDACCCSRLAVPRRSACYHPHGDIAPWLQPSVCGKTGRKRDACTTKLHPKTPGKQRGRIAPDAGFAVTENDYDDVAATSRSAADQAVAGRLGVTGLHPVAVRKTF